MADPGLAALQKIAESGTKVRLAPGVIGKGAMMWLGLILVWGIVVARLSPTDLVFDAILIVGASIVTWLVTRETQKMRDYAQKNPSTALLEGAELLAYQRFEARTKELPAGDRSPPTSSTGKGLATTGPDEPQT